MSSMSNYNSLQVSLQRQRFSRGFTFGAVYTYSKALTTANSDQDLYLFNALLDYREAGWNRTHVFAANYVYDRACETLRRTEMAGIYHRQLPIKRSYSI